MKSFIFASLVSLSIAGHAATIPVTLDNKNYRPLGAGYDSRASMFRGDCVEVSDTKTTDRHMASGTMSLKLEANQEALASKLGLSAGGRYRSGVAEYSASAEYLNEAKSNAFSIVYNYVSEDYYQEYAENSAGHPIKPRPGIEKYMQDKRPFFTNCGNEYVYSRTLAARLFVMMKISFVSKDQKEKFAARFGVDSPAFSMSANLEKAQSSFSSSNQITIRVEQQGGDPSKKGKILCPTIENGQPDPECARSARLAVNCSFGDLKPCMDVIANVIAYANAQDGENFPKQIENGKNFWVTQLDTRPFVYIGASFPAEPPKSTEDNFQAEVEDLNLLFEQEYDNWRYAHQLAKGKVPRLSTRQREGMDKISTKLHANMTRLAKAIENCYDFGYTKCSGELVAARKEVLVPDRPTIEHIEALTRPETFVQWCDLATPENKDAHTTIQTLKNYLLEKKILEPTEIQKGDFCVKLDERLSTLTELDLSNNTYLVGDLRAIGALKNLRQLRLPGKRLTSIEPLKDLVNLEYLDISDNAVSDVSPAATLKQLREIKLMNNRVTTLDALKGHPALENIDARGNGKLTCPLIDPSACKLLNLNNSTTVVLKEQNCGLRVGASAAALNGGSVLVSGGLSGDGVTIYRGSLALHTRDSCRDIGNLIHGRAGHTSTLLDDGRILIAGGYTDSVEIFDPVAMKSALLPSHFTTYRARHTATKLADGRVVFIGGTSSRVELLTPSLTPIAEVEIYDPKTNQITTLGRLDIPRMDHTATLLKDGRILVIGGYQMGQMVNAAEVIDVASMKIEMLDGALNASRSGHSAQLLSDGRVLIAGGYGWNEKGEIAGLGSLEIYDPSRDEFTLDKDHLEYSRGKMASFALPDGRVMFVGGDEKDTAYDPYLGAISSARNSIEIYDPATKGVYSSGKLVFARHLFAVAPISNKSWLVIGGMGAEGSSTSAELIVYRP